ncbi:Immunoglobulin domain and leucine-rich repeat-containing protein 2 [Caenorhabditis elegans]|uniref:Immunoglobulin domain and leucine-rich repeat-containing protein 2 n=1 Tax=Caenorhabditis elegans TaxID=6239 RepID=IGLR2_CAEEL|nr:Immunoglobulin domain and leucine-rich repeat-containing protein 2 [Caenorhabditis elegans]P34595.2 RecName: Full=Immunoglobulin domain and leucine-rich repeat-containing protein 2; Flags: Precursor [Caenorhabditis elegans]CCD69194.1 Immunoglobulin domain and leucine-rich repeat-containing protein 2 [Caenorhabditis elegans]|eukprot:NP_498834.1 Immunoglobulin domain and leucine-rich repeat-containing protein 2 [Caenorhabditis elegans]
MRKFVFFVVAILIQIHTTTSQRNRSSSPSGFLDLQLEKCPQVLGCRCVRDSTRNIQCFSIDESKLLEIQKIYGSNIQRLELHNWQHDQLNFDIFAPFPQLEHIILRDGDLESLNGTVIHPTLKVLSIENSELTSSSEVCRLLSIFPKIQSLSLSKNYFEKFECDTSNTKLKILDLSQNRISHLEVPNTLRVLNVSRNRLTSFENISTKLTDLDISFNKLSLWPSFDDWKFPNLRSLSAIKLDLQTGFQLDAPLLNSLNIDGASLRYLNFHQILTPKLKKFSARYLTELRNIAGRLPSTVTDVAFTDTMLRTLPADFIPMSSTNHMQKVSFDFSTNQLLCDKCLLQWSLPVYAQTSIRKDCNLTREEIESASCKIGVVANDTGIQYGKYEKPTAISCFSYGVPSPKISWWRFRPAEKLGSYDPITDEISYTNVSETMKESYEIQSGGSLLIRSPNRSHVERYVCVVENEYGKDYGIYHFRLDYLDWYSYDVFNSVFWGGLATSLIVCLISFLLNITWILTRKSALWWIQRAERLSRVRKMVEAMEKYRVRQMESLHEKYTKRVQIVRDNYHQQVEALRVSYASQQEKFQNYKAAQVDAVHSHLDAMRDGYNNQLGRVREYGSKRAEQLWESYERQVNRMRTFSLQHRLKMMRQYKVKQRYVNKLLESLQATSPEVQLENEEKVRAALEIPDDLATIDGSMDTPSRLSRSSSFHSLPEYVIDEQGNVRPGIIPTNAPSIRFTTKPTTSSISNEASTSSPSSSGAHRSPDSPPEKR